MQSHALPICPLSSRGRAPGNRACTPRSRRARRARHSPTVTAIPLDAQAFDTRVSGLALQVRRHLQLEALNSFSSSS